MEKIDSWPSTTGQAVQYNRWAAPEDRFWSRVRKTDTCWLWLGKKNDDGYGRIIVNNITITAHRYSWILHNGPIPDSLSVLHSCDTPGCIRPDHLFLGTQIDNINDMVNKGRQSAPIGELHPRAILTEAQVIEIRSRGQKQTSQRCRKHGCAALARDFGVSEGAIRSILQGKNWRHI